MTPAHGTTGVRERWRAASAPPDAPRDEEAALVSALWRGLDAFRSLSWLYACGLVWHRFDSIDRPAVAVAVLAALGLWSLAMHAHRRRTSVVLGAELALACAGILLTTVAEAHGALAAGAGTLPALWAAAPVMGWAVLRGMTGGLAAAAVVGLADVLAMSGRPTEGTLYNIVTLLLLGGCLGTCIDIARRANRALSEALRLQAENAERERLARTIHDGVLQALAFIHRRGEQLGGEAAELGRLAGAQERELRTLALGPARSTTSGTVDLRTALARLGSDSVTVSSPAGPVPLPGERADEIVAAIGAALANVDRHAGEGARAWVLVEDLGDTVVATVRDDGRGYAAGRLEQAADQGRLGVAASIDGRVRDLGGTVAHRSVPGQGTTVEITVPKAHRREA